MKKIFTLFAAAAVAICANAQTTVTFGAANVSGLEKDTDVACGCFTVPGTYFAAGTSKVSVYGADKGMKIRANKGADANMFEMAVTEGDQITKLVMGMVVNDASQTFKLTGIAIDGEALADFTSITLPNTGNADGSAVVNLDNIAATKTISFTFDFEDYTAKNKQVFIAGEATYTEATTAVSAIEAAGEAEYYNLQGVRVAEPANGLYIKRQGNKVEKVIVK